ncbi:lytic transglycosylase domain-containing protein [Stenotrophomonas sp. SORGH_AS_0282]|uniref:lytic transglycosylase domain-containing protein n=1 Tax=Stenotrophomonas sp. SORGH_AS_0282 TaxID=3041763 RepID=UPI00277E0B69|nr:lytic transglycosylase domain-containing protein [Stenotrophomonas sp. SORGH_AS_0282]MDQ1063643.1 membrane-bound lytic murein transglycosylase D [Stenotrophomonas sp. SORGH_AS_0282]MDQ1187993.1 membrane-bound lytic murein transglycosylase D [Stenotrophomonas sp. SORGH_AS_0282]
MSRRWLPLAAGLAIAIAGTAGAQSLSAGMSQNVAGLSQLPLDGTALPPASVRNGQDIFASFRDGLAEPTCDVEATSPRWQKQFAHAPSRLANQDDDALVLFGYVVEELRAANLPTEFALIPFVESGYRPNARNGAGPAGLWQFIASTARNHRVQMTGGYDGRLSAADSTQAAVRYLKTLHGMFGGDWRLATMAYNAGEYRVLQSLRKAGMNAQNARPAELPGLSPVTYAYVEKLHALACVLENAETTPAVMASLDRTVPVLKGHTLPAGTSVQQWAVQRSLDPARIARLNPALASGKGRPSGQVTVLAPATHAPVDPSVMLAQADAPVADTVSPRTQTQVASRAVASADRPKARRHTVRNGESAWTIAKRYGMPLKALLSLNNLSGSSVLKPGAVLRVED